MRYRSRKYLTCFAVFLFVSCYISSSFLFAYLRDVLCISELLQYLSELLISDDISCYWRNVNRSTVNNIIANSIFFHQTKCDTVLSLRDACSVEAAAGFHPNLTVYILFTSPIPKPNVVITELLKLPNVKVSRINIDTYAHTTPLNGFFQNSLVNGKVCYKKVENMLKFMTLFKYGGIILDFDVVIAKSLDGLGDNWVVKNTHLSTAIMKLSNNVLGHAAAGMVLSSSKVEQLEEKKEINSDKQALDTVLIFVIRKSFFFSNMKNQDEYADSNKALAAAFEELCASSSVDNITSKNCNGYQIYEDKLFFPISYSNRYKYFKPGSIDGEVQTYRIWNNEYRFFVPGDSLYAKIARAYCPKIFNSFMYEFTQMY